MQGKIPVSAIFTQLTAGAKPRLNFPANASFKAVFIPFAEELITAINKNLLRELTLPKQEQLVCKLATYCLRHELLRPENGEILHSLKPDLTEAIVDRPDRIMTQSIKGILTAHMQDKWQRAAQLRRDFNSLSTSTRSPSILWQEAGGYTLVELHTPAHLKAESLVLDHCIGQRHNTAALAQKNILPGSADEDNYLQYAIKMRKGECRIFSLRAPDGMPVATLRYDKRTKAIREVEGHEPQIRREYPHFPALCRALTALGQQMPVAKIYNLPPLVNKNEYCNAQGNFLMHEASLPRDMLYGLVRIEADISEKKLHELAGNPRLTLDISLLEDTRRLPRHIKADIMSAQTGNSLDLSHVETAADILCECSDIDLSNLKVCDDLHVPWVQHLNLPQLHTAASVTSSCQKISAPKFRDCGNLSLPYAGEAIYLPQFRRGLNVEIGMHARSLESADLPNLRHCLILVCMARKLQAPKLEYADAVELHRATQADLSGLAAIGKLQAIMLREATLPALITAESIEVDKCQLLTAPKLTNATKVILPLKGRMIAPLLSSDVQIERINSDYAVPRYTAA